MSIPSPHIWIPPPKRVILPGEEQKPLFPGRHRAPAQDKQEATTYINYVNTPAPAISGPTVFYRLGEASGTRVDSVGGLPNCDLADINTVTQATGKVGDAAQFTRANGEFLEVSDNSRVSMGDIDFTVFGWVYFDSKPASWMGIVSKAQSGGTEYSLLYDPNNDRLNWNVNTFAVERLASTFGSPPLSTWIFFLCWHDSVNNEVGIQINNGTADTTSYATGLSDTAFQFTIGINHQSAGREFDGRIDAVGLYKGLFTNDEKTELYNGGSGREYYDGAWH